VFEGEKEEDKG
jgi:hypothetical protein